MEKPWKFRVSCLEPAAQSDLGMATWPWAEQCPLTHKVPTEAGAGGRRRRRRKALLLPKCSKSTNTAVTLHLCSPWNFKQQGNETKLRMRQKWVLPCAGWGAGAGQGSRAGMSSVGVRGSWQQLPLRQKGQEAASIPICQSCVQPQAVPALVLIHHIPALPLTPSWSCRLYRQKINFRDTLVLWLLLALKKKNYKAIKCKRGNWYLGMEDDLQLSSTGYSIRGIAPLKLSCKSGGFSAISAKSFRLVCTERLIWFQAVWIKSRAVIPD